MTGTAAYSTPAPRRLHRVLRTSVAFAWLFAATAAAQNADGGVEQADGDPAPPRVTVRPLAEVAVTLSESAPARVVALRRAGVASQLSGVIERIDIDVGERVTAGEVLATLDCTEYRQDLARHEAQLGAIIARRTLADEQLKRALKLLPTRNISEEQVNQRRAEYDATAAELVAQRAQIAIANRQVDLCRIDAPFSGVVTARHVSLGDYLVPGTPVLELLDTGRLEVATDVPLSAGGEMAGEGLVFQADGRDYPVRLRTWLPLVDAARRTREARLVFTAEPTLAGTPGRLAWTTSEQALPAHLLVTRPEGLGVFLAEDGHARFVALPGALPGRPVAVELAADSRVVVEGRHRLEPGQPVDIVDR